jgi:hypothetical protein
MKRAILVVLSILLVSNSVVAQEFEAQATQEVPTCLDQYRNKMKEKQSKLDRIPLREIFNVTMGGAAVSAFFSVPQVAIPVLFIGLPTFAAASAILSAPINRLDKAESLYEGTRKFYKVVRSAQKLNPSITDEEVMEIIRGGFTNGEFCKSEKLASWREVRMYVLEQLENNLENSENDNSYRSLEEETQDDNQQDSVSTSPM